MLFRSPLPMDADSDGDLDLVVSCPDKPSNGLWFFENVSGRTSEVRFPVFRPGRFLGRTVHYVMPSYVAGRVHVLSPGYEYGDVFGHGLEQREKLLVDVGFHKPEGRQPKGPRVRHNQWRYSDYNGDGLTDLVVGIEDWSFYGWDDAWDMAGRWLNGPLHGWVYVFLNTGSAAVPVYGQPFRVQSAGRDLDVFGCPSPNFEDFDGDGDLDLICGEFLDGLTWFEKIGRAHV